MAVKTTRKPLKRSAAKKGRTKAATTKRNAAAKTKKSNRSRAGVKEREQKARRRQRRQQVRKIKQGFRQTMYGLYAISLVGVILLIMSVTFLLYQWKNVAIVEYSKEIQQLRSEMYGLYSEKSRNEARINKELMDDRRIFRIAKEQLGLERSIEQPRILKVDIEKLNYYARKDMEQEAGAEASQK